MSHLEPRHIPATGPPTDGHPPSAVPSEPAIRLEHVTLDVDRTRRCGYPEVVYGQGKTVTQISDIAHQLLARGERVLVTRLPAANMAALIAQFAGVECTVHGNEVAGTLRLHPLGESHATPTPGKVAIISAGTSDLPVAEEARETLAWMGLEATMVHDVGVAGPHRLPSRLAEFEAAHAVIVVAGMEGALPSVVGGYVGCPVIAVPTSVGYGANFGGLAALLSMLNSCAANVTVVNIDAGFKAGYLAGLIAAGRGA